MNNYKMDAGFIRMCKRFGVECTENTIFPGEALPSGEVKITFVDGSSFVVSLDALEDSRVWKVEPLAN